MKNSYCPYHLESFETNSSLLQAPKTLKDYIKQYQQHNRKLHLHKQSDNTNSKIKSFISSFIADIIGFSAALLTVLITLVIVYIITGHSKLKTLVANMALQCIKTVEATALNPHYTICKIGRVRIFMILNLSIVTLMALAKLKKSKIFKSRPFSNTIKIKLFIVHNKCYIPLHLNKMAGSVHLFKMHGMLIKENLTLKKNWILDALEIDWTDVYVLQHNKEINLPVTVVIPIYYKLKIRQLLMSSRRDSLYLYVMLKQRKS